MCPIACFHVIYDISFYDNDKQHTIISRMTVCERQKVIIAEVRLHTGIDITLFLDYYSKTLLLKAID